MSGSSNALFLRCLSFNSPALQRWERIPREAPSTLPKAQLLSANNSLERFHLNSYILPMVRIALVLLLVTTTFAQTATPVATISRIISITDKHGNSVSATLGDLHVTVNGAEVSGISLAPLLKRRFRAVVLLDFSGSMRDKEIVLGKYAADTVGVLSAYGITPAMCVFNERKTCNIQANEVLGQLNKIHPEGSANLSSAIYSAEILFSEQWAHDENAAGQLIVLITDGDIKLAQIERLKLNNIIVFPIGLLGPEGSIDAQRKTLLSLAKSTGGRAILMDSPVDLRKQLKRTFDSEYELVIAVPEGVREPDIHVETTRRDWRIDQN